jgi:hypothetical protein
MTKRLRLLVSLISATLLLSLIGALPARGQTAEIIGSVDWDGSPVPNATLDLEAGSFGSPVLATATASSDGSFVISNPPTGQFTLYAVAPSNEYWQWVGLNVTVTPGQITNVGTLTLSKILQLTSPANGASISTTTPTLQ